MELSRDQRCRMVCPAGSGMIHLLCALGRERVRQDRDEIEVLFTLLAERYERGSVLITSNLPFSRWEEILEDPMTTAAAKIGRAHV